MNRFILKTFFLLFFALSAAASVFAAEYLESSSKDQKLVDLVVYNDNLALVRDVRAVSLPSGNQQVKYLDVPASAMPETIQVRSITAPKEFSVIEQSYLNNTFDSSKLLEAFVGKKIKIMNWNEYQDRKEVVEATLLSNYGEPIYQVGNEIYLGYSGTRILPEIPAGYVTKTAFIWKVSNQTVKPQELEVSYLTGGLNWKADYVLTIGEGASAQFSSWVTVNNQSGVAFKNAGLKLLAGDINRVSSMPPPRAMMMKASMAMDSMAESGGGFQEKPVMDYHAYELGRKADLGLAESKQLQFLKPQAIQTEKEYRVESGANFYGRMYPGQEDKQPVKIILHILNKKENGLGMPLPAGTVRVYRREPQGAQYFMGEDQIQHTAQDEEIKLHIGQAFDLTAEKKQTDFKQITNQSFETEWEITLKNRKEEDVNIHLVENLSGNWQILSQSSPFEKEDAFHIKFKVKVPKKGESKIRYRIRVGVN